MLLFFFAAFMLTSLFEPYTTYLTLPTPYLRNHKARIAEAESLLSLSQVNTLASPNPESAGIAPMNGPTDEPTGPSVSMRVSDPLAAEKLAALKAMLSPQTPAIVTTTDDEEVAKLTVLAEKLETNEAALEKFVSPPSGRRGGIHLLQRMVSRRYAHCMNSSGTPSLTQCLSPPPHLLCQIRPARARERISAPVNPRPKYHADSAAVLACYRPE